MVATVQPRQPGVAGEKVDPALQRVGHFYTQLSRFFHDRGARVRSEDIGPELSAGKPAAHIHDEADGLVAFLLTFTRKREDDVEGRPDTRGQATGRTLVDGGKVLEILVHGLPDLLRAGFGPLAYLVQAGTMQQF